MPVDMQSDTMTPAVYWLQNVLQLFQLEPHRDEASWADIVQGDVSGLCSFLGLFLGDFPTNLSLGGAYERQSQRSHRALCREGRVPDAIMLYGSGRF